MMKRMLLPLIAATLLLSLTFPAYAVVIDFFDPAQSYELVQSGTSFDTILTEGYLFQYTRDKLFTGGLGGGPIGRPVSIDWPNGLQAQAVTVGTVGPAKFTITRQDGDVFDLPAFTIKLLANTAGAGGSIEVMPKLNGEDAFTDPIALFATGNAGNTFTYTTTSPVWMGNTTAFVGFDTYQISLYVDFAITDIQLNGALVAPEPTTISLIAAAVLPFFCRRRRAN